AWPRALDDGDLPDDAAAIAESCELHDDVDGRRYLRPDVGGRQIDVRHHRHRLQASERMSGRVRMRGTEAPLVARVHGLPHVERLAAAHLPDDDPVGSLPASVALQMT